MLAGPRSPSHAETIETHGCSIVLRRLEGVEARELFLLCAPSDAGGTDVDRQAEAAYRAILAVLEAEGASDASVVRETLFLRSLREDLESIRAARRRVMGAREESCGRPAVTEVEQPPLRERARFEISLHAVSPLSVGKPLRLDVVRARPLCNCAECGRGQGLRVHMADQVQLHAAGLYGPGDDAYQQALAMFAVAEDLLCRAGMEFRDVVRTWIHLRDIDRDYAALNRARREFFAARDVGTVPASTGIGGRPVPDRHELSLGFYAVRAGRSVMSAPSLGEAMHYGSDFVRGLRIAEANKVALHVSGTASIDEAGRTAHPADFDAQAERMLANVAALLDGQGASFGDVVSAVTYLKRPADGARLLRKLRDAGFEGFPNAVVIAPICRPELLCETEVLAVLT